MLNAIRIYRIAYWLYMHHVPVLPKLLQLLIFVTYNCSVSYKMSIGGVHSLIMEDWEYSSIRK